MSRLSEDFPFDEKSKEIQKGNVKLGLQASLWPEAVQADPHLLYRPSDENFRKISLSPKTQRHPQSRAPKFKDRFPVSESH